MAYYYRERIRGRIYKIRWPEKVIKVVMHYKGTHLYKVFWRVIPNKKSFKLDGEKYFYMGSAVVKANDYFCDWNEENLICRIPDAVKQKRIVKDVKTGQDTIFEETTYSEYDLGDVYKIRRKEDKWPEIHFIYGCPVPVDWESLDDGQIKLNSKVLQEMTENDQVVRLLTLDTQKSLLILVMVAVVFNTLLTGFLLAKNMGWIK